MRVYLPLSPADHELIRDGAGALQLEPGRDAWCVSAEARASATADEEDLEYEAMQDAVHVALANARPEARVLVIAGDVPDRALGDGADGTGLYGARLTAPARMRVASLHVTELSARAAEQSDTDPALLWFDAQEGLAALAYLGEPQA